MVRKTLILAACLALGGCVTARGDFCQISSPIRLSNQIVEQMSDSEVNDVLRHNRLGQELCGWSP